MKLGTLLLRDAVITLSQLEEALRAQVLFGGRLGTNLVELGFIDLTTLGLCLSRVHGLPLATQERFEVVQPATIAEFPVRLADTFLAFPLGPELRAPDLLGVAIAHPQPHAVDELSERLRRPITPYVAPELRILYYIERRYGLQRSARFVRAADPAGRPVTGERRRTRSSSDMPAAVRLEPRRIRPVTAPEAPPQARPQVPYLTACSGIDTAEHRDQIADRLLQFCVGRFEVAVVFILRSNFAVGWRAQAADGKPRAVEQVSLPLGAASALQVANDTALPYRGAPPSAGRPIERQLWRDLEVAGEPEDVAVVPVVVRKRVVNLIYVHGNGLARLEDDHVAELAELALRASDRYVRLIQATKAGDSR